MTTIESLNNLISDNQPLYQNENSSTTSSTSSTSNESIQILTNDTNQVHENVETQITEHGVRIESKLININDINFDLNMKWKIRGLITFKYDIRQFNSEYGEGDIFNFDITDNSGEITIVCFNLSARILQAQIEKDNLYEITNLSIKTANEKYKTLQNKFQLISTNKTIVTEIRNLLVTPVPYAIIKLENLDVTNENSVIDIQCRVVRDYGISTGISNDRHWTRRDLHVLDGNYTCRLTLWGKQARFHIQSLARLMIKCKYVKVKWFNGAKLLSSMDNTLITIEQNH